MGSVLVAAMWACHAPGRCGAWPALPHQPARMPAPAPGAVMLTTNCLSSAPPERSPSLPLPTPTPCRLTGLLPVVLYLSYMGLLVWCLFLAMGTIGFLSSFAFTYAIFNASKSVSVGTWRCCVNGNGDAGGRRASAGEGTLVGAICLLMPVQLPEICA